MTTRIVHRAFGRTIASLALGIVGALLLLSRLASTESLNRPELVDRALRLCHRIPDDDCRDLGPEMLYRPVRNEVRARRLRASAKVDLTLQLIRQAWLAGRHEDARAEAAKLISWSRKQRCPEDADGERMRERLIDVLRAPGTTGFQLEIVQRRARENPDYAALGAAAHDTFRELMACSSIDDALAFLSPLPDTTRLQLIVRSQSDLPGRAPLDSIVALQQRLPSGSVEPGAYNNLAIVAARAGRLDIAKAAVDAMPDAYLHTANVASLVALEFARAGRTSEAMRLVTRAFDLNARRDSLTREGLDINGFGYAGAALVRVGAFEELARRRPAIPDVAWRAILMVRASEEAGAGHTDEALADIRSAQLLPVWFYARDNPVDDGVVEWIGAQADSGHDAMAVRALTCLHSRTLRGAAWSRIAKARARAGDVTGATAAADSITQSTFGLAEAVPAVSTAQAVAGSLERSLLTLDTASARLTAMCGLPNDGPVGICGHAPECPPVSMIFDMRRQALRGIGATIRTREELDRLMARREPVEQATILLGAIESGSQ